MGAGNGGPGFSRMLPADLGVTVIFERLEKAEVLTKSRSIWLFHFTVQVIWGCPLPLGFGKILAEQRIKLKFGEIFSLRS